MAPGININKILKKYGLRPKSQWSQNFLVDPEVMEAIVEAANVEEHPLVIELGAGLGVLSAMLAARAEKVVAVEKDRDLVGVLRAEFALDPVVEVLEANAAKLDYADIVKRLGQRPVVVGNLPYHMATPILFHLLTYRDVLADWILMFQKEFADRLSAQPGSRTYGVISVLFFPYVEVEPVLEVAPEAFYPPPKVRSSVLRIKPCATPRLAIRDESVFKQVVKAAFGQRRKKLRNALLAVYERQLGKHSVDRAMRSAGVDASRRAEECSAETFVRLSHAFCDLGCGHSPSATVHPG